MDEDGSDAVEESGQLSHAAGHAGFSQNLDSQMSQEQQRKDHLEQQQLQAAVESRSFIGAGAMQQQQQQQQHQQQQHQQQHHHQHHQQQRQHQQHIHLQHHMHQEQAIPEQDQVHQVQEISTLPQQTHQQVEHEQTQGQAALERLRETQTQQQLQQQQNMHSMVSQDHARQRQLSQVPSPPIQQQVKGKSGNDVGSEDYSVTRTLREAILRLKLEVQAEKNRQNCGRVAHQFILEEGDKYLAVSMQGQVLGEFRSSAPLLGPIINVNADGSLDFLLEYYFADRVDFGQGGIARLSFNLFLERCKAAGSFISDGNLFDTRAKCKKTRLPVPGQTFSRSRRVVGVRDRYIPAEARWWRTLGYIPGMGDIASDSKGRRYLNGGSKNNSNNSSSSSSFPDSSKKRKRDSSELAL